LGHDSFEEVLPVTVPNEMIIDDHFTAFFHLFVDVETLEAQSLVLNCQDREEISGVLDLGKTCGVV
jgi:hypothetical protein